MNSPAISMWGRKPMAKYFIFSCLLGKGVGQEHDHGQLGELGGLEGQGTQTHPAGRPPHLAAEARQKYQDQAERLINKKG